MAFIYNSLLAMFLNMRSFRLVWPSPLFRVPEAPMRL